MRRSHGPSLPLGKQLCRILQPEVLLAVLGLCLCWLHARFSADGLARHLVHGQELQNVPTDLDDCSDSSCMLLRSTLRPLRRNYVR